VSPGEGARLVRVFEPAIEAAKRIISRSKIASKGQNGFGDEEKPGGLSRGWAPNDQTIPKPGSSLYNLSIIKMVLRDAPFLTLVHGEVNN